MQQGRLFPHRLSFFSIYTLMQIHQVNRTLFGKERSKGQKGNLVFTITNLLNASNPVKNNMSNYPING
jgi:hypothetical protein